MMRWRSKWEYGQWYWWFAWKPVFTELGQWVWFEFVERRQVSYGLWEYR